MSILAVLTCEDIPVEVTNVISTIFNVIKWGVPAILILVGMFEMGKAMTKQKEDEIKKAQSSLVKKAVAALVVFLIPTLVGLLLKTVDVSQDDQGWVCAQKMLGIEKDAALTDSSCASQTTCPEGQTAKVVDGKCACQ